MAHAQKPDFVFRRKMVSPFKSAEASVQSTTGSRGVRISGSNAGYSMFRGSVKGTGYPLHSPVSPSLPFPCVTVCHHLSTGLYSLRVFFRGQFLLVCFQSNDIYKGEGSYKRDVKAGAVHGVSRERRALGLMVVPDVTAPFPWS